LHLISCKREKPPGKQISRNTAGRAQSTEHLFGSNERRNSHSELMVFATGFVKVSRTPALRSLLPRARWRASWKAQGLTRGWLALYGDLKRTPGSTVAMDSACVCIVRIETERRVWV